ncbi:hypothetical protein DPMN_042673 [Dreissena polymorpha]|uniref:Uncharacterized protein n=1 Tax=Dreissena polymorpha TaxID=45954 RepID=A0A9D4CZ12_DREPO|nr:hypothetical protein DPMN_042673 [Dreissena polymorpha]
MTLTNLLTKFHEDRTINVASRVFTNKCERTDGRRTKTSHKSSPEQSDGHTDRQTDERTDGQKTATSPWQPFLTKFHENLAKNVLTCFQNIHIEKNAPPTGGHVFSSIQLTGTIFKLNSRIKETNVLTKFHENWAKNVPSRVLTCFHYIHVEKNAPPTGDHVFFTIWTIFELVRKINKTNVLTNFDDDWAKIVTSRVFTRKTAPPTDGHVFQRTGTTFELNQHIIKTNILTNFELDRDFIGTKLLTKFHEDRTINVAARVFTNKC